MGRRESTERGLPEETIKISNKQPKLGPKESEKEQSSREQKEGNNTNQRGNRDQSTTEK